MRRFFTFLAWPLLVVPQIFYWFGALLNQIAMATNGGVMPVLWNSMNVWPEDPRHVIMTPMTHLKVICDWINLSDSILSPGDVSLFFGELLKGPFFWAWITYLLYRAFRDEIALY